MHTATLTTTLLAFTGLAISTSIPINDHNLALLKRDIGPVTYCSAPSICSPLSVSAAKCETLARGYSDWTIPEGTKCDLYNLGSCDKAFDTGAGKLHNVEGHIDTTTDPRAKNKDVPTVLSLRGRADN
ncbi:Uu.00g009590.m01.CDS01 [Anthostomella pinea]|uniref:Uu.00g009590.m01.CDS01 n=1 Tax=Anthostomella pinea TaxID=933095 RepID=A0AAI8VYB4_9PEZI|nr:Uu.00g009590.m01.CDS01 [Anthostomella pinea]